MATLQLYTNSPAIITDLVARARAEADADAQPLTKFNAIGQISWWSLIEQMRLFKEALELYQTFLLDGDLQDVLDELGEIHWYNILHRVDLFIKAVEIIESIT